MWGILIRIGILVIVVLLFIFTGSFLSMWVRKPLIELCNQRNLNASPWKFFLWEILLCYLFLANESETGVTSVWYVKGLLFLLIVIPILVLFYRAKLFFGPLILIKLVCIPLDLLYVITGCYKDPDYTPMDQRTNYNHTLQGSDSTNTNYSSNQGNGYQPASTFDRKIQEEQGFAGGDTQEPYVYEKYRDMEDTRQNSEDSYHTVKIGENTAYYNGDYAPFSESGGSVEVRTYDSDYAPME